MTAFAQILGTTGPVRYEYSERGHLKMVEHFHPWSIKETEFYFIVSVITHYRLTKGFEVATAFGISALAAAVGMSTTGGHLCSMDAYVEEDQDDAGTYEDIQPVVNPNADGYRSALYLAEAFGVRDQITFTVGWSPRDTATSIEKVFGPNAALNYAFIDGGHYPDQIISDLEAVAPFLTSGFLLCHDVYPDTFTEPVKTTIRQLFGTDLQVVIPPPFGENLGYLQINPETQS